ncbi:MAG: fimbrillin family protein [Duncaniella sp.]|nr:fimbrillin family protein [Duncaniella sp.]MDE7145119.1 fimbrillin family protein [Duncaniella sp.]
MSYPDKLMTLLALLLLAGCSDDHSDIPEEQSSCAIEFAAPVLNNMSRNSAPTFPFDNFRIYAFTDDAQYYIYDGAEVDENGNGKWICDQREYWYPEHTYWFTALAPGESQGMTFTPVREGEPPYSGGGTLHYNAMADSAKTDILYAFRKEVTPSIIPDKAPAVDLEFNHLLAQLTFTFYNELGNPHYFINVPSITLGNLYSEGEIDLNSTSPQWERTGYGTFWTGAGRADLIKVNDPKTSAPVYILPIKPEGAVIQLQTHLFYIYNPEDTTGIEFSAVKTFTVDFPDIDLKAGHSYNIIAHLNHNNVDGPQEELTPISFEIEDRSWRYDYIIDVNTR